jgi:transcriptional regulator with XRE-family HTH domain
MDRIIETQSRLARELRKARDDARLSQEQLAELASISTGPIYLFESGKASIRLETYLKLLDALGLDLLVVPRKPRANGL